MKRILALLLMLAFVAACGCAPVEKTGEAAKVALTSGAVSVIPDAEKTAAEVDAAISEFNKRNETEATETSTAAPEENAPLCIVKSATRCGMCSIIYPRVCGGETAERINEAVCNAACERASAFGIPVLTGYTVEYNRNGIFSIRIYIYDLYNAASDPLGSFSLNFNAETGELLTMSNLFTKDGEWRGEIPDIIAEQAVQTDMVLLSELPPIDDDQQFYITSNGIVLTYGLYEIATYSAGEPEFCIAVGEVADYVADDSAINCFVASSTTTTAAATAAAAAPASETTLASETTFEEAGAE